MPLLSRDDFCECVGNVLKHFPEVRQLSENQAECLFNFMQQRDVFAMLPTGHGKSLIFQMVPAMCQELHNIGYPTFPENAVMLVLCPLISLIESHIKELNERGFSCVCLTSDEAIKQKPQVLAGKYSFLFASPEAIILNESWRNMLQSRTYQLNLFGIVTDEAHVIPKWGYGNSKKQVIAFRECFSRIGELRSLVPNVTPVLALTATATQKTIESVKAALNLKSDHYMVKVSPDRPNIYLYKAKVNNNLNTAFGWLVEVLISERQLCPKMIVYCKTTKECGKLFTFFKECLQELAYADNQAHTAENMLIGMFHHNTLVKYKHRIINSFYIPDGVCRVVFATNALGMGINFPDVRYVVHYGPPRSVEDFVQEIGRAGRDGGSAISILLYQGKHLRKCERNVKEYAKSEDCLRSILLSEFSLSKEKMTHHDCCLSCHQKCSCQVDSPCCRVLSFSLPKLHIMPKDSANPQMKRKVRKEDLQLLEDLLKDYQKELSASCPPFYLSPECTTGFSDELIKAVLTKARFIFNMEFILEHLSIFKVEHAIAIVHMVADVFEDFTVNIDPEYMKPVVERDADFHYDLEYGGNYSDEENSDGSDNMEDVEAEI